MRAATAPGLAPVMAVFVTLKLRPVWLLGSLMDSDGLDGTIATARV
jgi:hypothetical protein